MVHLVPVLEGIISTLLFVPPFLEKRITKRIGHKWKKEIAKEVGFGRLPMDKQIKKVSPTRQQRHAWYPERCKTVTCCKTVTFFCLSEVLTYYWLATDVFVLEQNEGKKTLRFCNALWTLNLFFLNVETCRGLVRTRKSKIKNDKRCSYYLS